MLKLQWLPLADPLADSLESLLGQQVGRRTVLVENDPPAMGRLLIQASSKRGGV
jgi:hypothetical protein